ncbi:MAG: 50S ribosomal protein L4 [Phycisphaerales bacterium JB052]
MDVPVYSMSGAAAGTMSVDEIALGESVNADLLKQAFVMYHANKRQGSARTKNRSATAYTTKKLYKQKGTGRARHGDKGANIFRGGGHAKQKTRSREDYHQSMPKKMRRKANRNALLAKLLDNEVKVVDGLSFDSPRTKDFVDFLSAINVDRSSLVALSGDAEKSKNARLSARNVDGVQLCRADQLNAYEMLNNRYLVIDKADLEAWLSGPSSQTGKAVAGEA